MKRTPDDLDQLKQELLEDPETRAAYAALEDEFNLISLLIDARLEKHLTQAQLADKLGMKQSAIARLESGQSNPRYKTLARVAKALDKEIRFV
jgi:DNA-binding XRE family transcriptional regulator